jgi:hypothetical protein
MDMDPTEHRVYKRLTWAAAIAIGAGLVLFGFPFYLRWLFTFMGACR